METEIKCTRVTDTVLLSIFPFHKTGDKIECPRQMPWNITCRKCSPGNQILIKELDYNQNPFSLTLDPEASNIPAWDLPID